MENRVSKTDLFELPPKKLKGNIQILSISGKLQILDISLLEIDKIKNQNY